MKRATRWLFLVCLWALLPASAAAQLVNGNFETGGLGWGAGGPVTWSYSFPATGGNPDGHAQINSATTASGGQSCITQQFFCGAAPEKGTICSMSVQYFLDNVQAQTGSGRVRILLDGVEKHVSPPGDDIGWTTVTFAVPCGSHQLALCLQVDPGDNAWEARFDNALAECDVVLPAKPSTWGKVKILYR